MLKGYTLPRTPRGTSSLAPMPPWHYVGTAVAVEFETDRSAAASFLPAGLELHSARCAAYFIEWQYASEIGEEYLDPIRSQYKETIFLLSAAFDGAPVAYCPFIWVDQDVSLMRGLVQGGPSKSALLGLPEHTIFRQRRHLFLGQEESSGRHSRQGIVGWSRPT